MAEQPKLVFQTATKKQARLRLALMGPSGSGKTFTALRVAKGLGGRVAVVDSERASASKYADRFSFSTLELESFHPQRYIDAILAAEQQGYEVLVIDSLSHAWTGKDGALELKDAAAARSKSKDSFGAWREVTPLHNALVDAILRSRCHVIATMRTKTEYVVEEVNGKKTPRKVGLAPVQRDGMEYEFDLVGDLDDATLVITKSRCPQYTKAVLKEPGEELGVGLKAWLTDGVEVPLPAPQSAPQPTPALAPAPVGRPRLLKFGPHRGARIEKLTMEQLRDAIVFGWEQAEKPENLRFLQFMRGQLQELEAEMAGREAELTPRNGASVSQETGKPALQTLQGPVQASLPT